MSASMNCSWRVRVFTCAGFLAVCVCACGAQSDAAGDDESSMSCDAVATSSQRVSTRCSALGLQADSDEASPSWGQVDCRAFAFLGYAAECPCDGAGFSSVSEHQRDLVADRSFETWCAEPPSGTAACVCELEQMSMPLLEFCHQEVPNGAPAGWCYINPPQGFGDPALTEECHAGHQERFRVIGTPRPGQTGPAYEVFFFCSRSSDVPRVNVE